MPPAAASAGKKRKQPAAVDQHSDAAAKIIKLVERSEGQIVKQADLEEKMKAVPQHVMLAALNQLMSSGRLVTSVGPRGMFFKLQSAENAAKLANLTGEDRLVLQDIEKSRTTGVESKDLKRSTSLATTQLTKILKKLEARGLVKGVKAVGGSGKKYLLAGLEPGQEITGGTFYSGAEFDHELVNVLAKTALAFIQRKGKATAQEVNDFIAQTGLIRGMQLKASDLERVLNTLVYDATAEVIRDPLHGSDAVYRTMPPGLPSIDHMVDSLMSLPPARCECEACLGGGIQPCAAMDAWLDQVAPTAQ